MQPSWSADIAALYKEDRTIAPCFLPVATGHKTRSNGLKLQERKCRTKSLVLQVVKHCDRLAREVGESPAWDGFLRAD